MNQHTLNTPQQNSSSDPFFESIEQRGGSAPVDLIQYWRIIRKHIWSILGLAVVVGILAALVATSLTPIYTATTTVIIQKKAPQTLDYRDMYQYYQGRQDYMGTQYELLISRAVVSDLVDRLKLWEHEYYVSKKIKPAGDDFSLGKLLPFFRSKDKDVKSKGDDFESVRDTIINDIRAGIEITPTKKSNVVHISFSSDDPDFAALIANELIESHIQKNMEARFLEVQKATSWITDRLKGLRSQLDESETVLQDYRKQANIVDVGAEGAASLIGLRLEDLSDKLIQERIRFNELRVLKQQADRYRRMSLDDLLNTPSIYKHPALNELKTKEVEASRRVEELQKRYGPKHPKMRQAIADLDAVHNRYKILVPSILRGITDDYEVSQNNLASLQSEYDELKSEVRDVNVKEFKLEKLESDVEADKKLLNIFLEEYKETNLTSSFESDQVRVVDAATAPQYPVKPNKQRIVMIAVFGAIIFGVGLALLIELLDNTIRTSEDVERKLHLPVLGLLNNISSKEIRNSNVTIERYYLDDEKTNFAETVRTIRTGISLSAIDDPYKTILVTSSLPGEGKTSVACNVALAMSQLEKTLIIDADMRRPSTSKIFGYDHNSPGMSELLIGEAGFEDLVHEVEGTSLNVITAGKIPPDPLEMLASKKFKSFLEEMSGRYERVIIDSPPVSLVSDPVLLSSLVDTVVLVVKYDETNSRVIDTAVKKLKQASAHITGVVVNHVDMKKMSKYYGYGYGKYYSSGYYTYTDDVKT